MRIVQKHILN